MTPEQITALAADRRGEDAGIRSHEEYAQRGGRSRALHAQTARRAPALSGIAPTGDMTGQQDSRRTMKGGAKIQRIDPSAVPVGARFQVAEDLEVVEVRMGSGSVRP